MSNAPGLILDGDAAAAELCTRHFSYFVKEFWDVVIAEDLVWSDHMEIMCEEIQKVYEQAIARKPKLYDLIINIPPGTSKSTICTIMAPAWAWCKDDSLRCITASYSDSLATEHSVKSRDIIESDRYRRYFPWVEIKYDKGRKTNYESTGLGQRYATSVGGSVTGVHAHVITIDDPLNPKQAASQVECVNANNFIDKTLSMRKIDKKLTPTILVMQRLATNDCTGYLLSKKKTNVRHVCLPAESSPHVSPPEYKTIYKNGLLDPERLGAIVLAEAKIDLGSEGYAGQMGQVPVPDGGLIWQKWFIPIDDSVFPKLVDLKNVGTDWDLAYTKDDTNAGNAYIRSGTLNNKMFIDDLGVVYMEFPELIKFMRTNKAPHYIEAKASGKSAKQTLVKMKIPAIEVQVSGKGDKVARAKMSSPYAEAGMVYVRKSLIDFLYNDIRQGILNFPKGSHADLSDVLAQAIQRIFRGGIVIAGGSKSILDGIK